jgi:Fur family ferric uptake transcriptional regulator
MLEDSSRDIGEIEAWCRDRSVRPTKAQRAILEVLATATGQPCAHEVHRLVSARKRIGLATVYRALNGLTAAGIVARHEFGDGKARYECAHRGRHPHLIDLDNGRIEKVDVSGLAELLQVEARRLGFRLVNYRLQIMVSALEPAG